MDSGFTFSVGVRAFRYHRLGLRRESELGWRSQSAQFALSIPAKRGNLGIARGALTRSIP